MTSSSLSALTGKLVLTIGINDSCKITNVTIDNTRPANIGRILTGKSTEQALSMMPTLFLLCSQAQQTAALGAIAKAKEEALSPEIKRALADRCALEWLKEHCWNLWQMQRDLFNDKFATKPSLNLNRLLLQTIHALPTVKSENESLTQTPAEKWTEIGKQLEPLFGATPAEFIRFKWSELIDWTLMESPYALHFSVVLHNASTLGSDDHWTAGSESGSLVRQIHHPLVKQALECWGSGLTTRMLSRLIEICHALESPEIASAPEPGLAYASRGILEHQIKLDDSGNIQSYSIDAPTDRYFGKEGIVESALLNQQLENDDPTWIRQLIWAIDPCVEFEVKIRK